MNSGVMHCSMDAGGPMNKKKLQTKFCEFVQMTLMRDGETRLWHQYSLLQQPLRRQTQMQMQQKRTRATNPDAPAIRMVMFKGSGGTGIYIDM